MDKYRSSPLVSFVLPHHGRNDLLFETIASIASQDMAADNCEVIIVSKDCAMTNAVLELGLTAAKVQLIPLLLSIASDETISSSRNQGALKATGEYLAFIDADVRLASNWTSTMTTLLANSENVVASAVQTPDIARTTNDLIRSAMSEAKSGSSVSALPGANLFLRRIVFKQSNKFPEHLETCEDSVFTNSLLKVGKLILTKETGFVHLGEDLSFKALLLKEIWRGKSNLESIEGRNVPIAELPSLIVPVLVLCSVVLTIVSLLFGGSSVAVLFFLAALMPCLAYALRLRCRSGIAPAYPKVALFYLIYFVARGIGMVKRAGEALLSLFYRVLGARKNGFG